MDIRKISILIKESDVDEEARCPLLGICNEL